MGDEERDDRAESYLELIGEGRSFSVSKNVSLVLASSNLIGVSVESFFLTNASSLVCFMLDLLSFESEGEVSHSSASRDLAPLLLVLGVFWFRLAMVVISGVECCFE